MMIILAFAAGCAIGANWPKIKKYLMQQKEQMEDLMAASEITKKTKNKAKQRLTVAAVSGAAVAEELAGEEAAVNAEADERQVVAANELPVSSSSES